MKQQTQMLPLVAGTDSYSLIIPENVEFKIREWCRLNPTTEWSGTLFYDVEGSFNNKDIKFTVRDFIVMDIGTAGFTNYKETPEICSYMMENDLLDCKTGLIHSHNSMKAFFSGTDANTLIEEGSDITHFLSLVVNNEGSYVARVTRKVMETIEGVKNIKYTTYNGVEVSSEENVKITNREYIQYFDLNIIVNNPYIHIKDSVAARYKELKKPVVTNNFVNSNLNYSHFFETSNKGLLVPNKEVKEDKEEKIDTKQLTLFNSDDDEEISDTIKGFVGQLIYGNMLLSPESFKKFTKVNEWITTNMEKAFDSRFGKSPVGFTAYQDWMFQFCDSIIWSAANNAVNTREYIEIEDAAPEIACDMAVYLQELICKAFKKGTLSECPINDYLSYIIECLEGYINQ